MIADGRQKNAAGRLRRGERVQIAISPDAAEQVTAEAELQMRTISQMLRIIVEDWARQRKDSRPPLSQS